MRASPCSSTCIICVHLGRASLISHEDVPSRYASNALPCSTKLLVVNRQRWLVVPYRNSWAFFCRIPSSTISSQALAMLRATAASGVNIFAAMVHIILPMGLKLRPACLCRLEHAIVGPVIGPRQSALYSFMQYI